MTSSNAPTALLAVPSALIFLAPLFAMVLLGLTVFHPPVHALRDRRQRTDTLVSYLAIGSLATLCTIAGGMSLGGALGSGLGMRGRGEACVEALIFLELGVTVLYLAKEHIVHDLKRHWAIALVMELVCAAIVSFIYPPSSQGSVAPFLAPVLSLLFLTSVLPLLVFALRVHMAKQAANNAQTCPMREIRTPSFSGTNTSSAASDASSSLPSSSSHPQEKLASPKSSLSELTAVNHYQLSSCLPRSGHVDASSLESGAPRPRPRAMGRWIASNRSTSLMLFLIASQGAAFMAYVLETAAVKVGLSMTSTSVPSSASDKGAYAYAILQIFRTALMVVSITGIMSALLLHAYNAYLRAAPTPRQVATVLPTPPPPVSLSRMNAITVAISTTAAAALPLSTPKKRSADNQGVLSDVSKGLCGTDKASEYGHRSAPCMPLSRHSSSASYSSSFACQLARTTSAAHSTLLSSETIEEVNPRSPDRDSRLEDDEDGEPGYAYIYTDGRPSDGEQEPYSRTDPLNVGRSVPFRPRQQPTVHIRGSSSRARSPPPKHGSSRHSHSESITTRQSVENSAMGALPSPPLLATRAPIDIPSSKSANPYPTPRSTPTATAFAERASSPDVPSSPNDSIVPLPLSRTSTSSSKGAKSSFTACSSSEGYSPSSTEMRVKETGRNSYCGSSSTHMPAARTSTSTPTPTPTRAPTPGLSFTPFLGSHVRKRDSSSMHSVRSTRPCPPPPTPPSPSSPFMASLKGKARKLSSKHDSISESLAHSFEGIRNGLGGSNGKTKYPLRSSTSAGSLGLGLGMASGFKFPQLTRRASELDKGQRNRSCSTLAETSCLGVIPSGKSVGVEVAEGVLEPLGDGDFMDLRDPFACPNVTQGGQLRILSQAELNVRTGRESRAGCREEEGSEGFESGAASRSGSCGKARGMRMSAWGRLPLSPSSSVSTSPMSLRRLASQTTPTPSPSKSRKKGGKSKSKGKGSRGSEESAVSAVGSSEGGRSGEEFEFGEEALIAQQLLRKLDEKLWAASEVARG
ncbi:hypothetical protein D9611_013254 [Ephemerocybe angulata]|uniref:Uncharacterized protein n=1 Tax=Ephemerocybe angulata TaxID=980116 RepID=A0A8H5FIZ1_9AGAR|nr:hypothetical protein D9611_013254 [Tulosesus angulatus]